MGKRASVQARLREGDLWLVQERCEDCNQRADGSPPRMNIHMLVSYNIVYGTSRLLSYVPQSWCNIFSYASIFVDASKEPESLSVYKRAV